MKKLVLASALIASLGSVVAHASEPINLYCTGSDSTNYVTLGSNQTISITGLSGRVSQNETYDIHVDNAFVTGDKTVLVTKLEDGSNRLFEFSPRTKGSLNLSVKFHSESNPFVCEMIEK